MYLERVGRSYLASARRLQRVLAREIKRCLPLPGPAQHCRLFFFPKELSIACSLIILVQRMKRLRLFSPWQSAGRMHTVGVFNKRQINDMQTWCFLCASLSPGVTTLCCMHATAERQDPGPPGCCKVAYVLTKLLVLTY